MSCDESLRWIEELMTLFPKPNAERVQKAKDGDGVPEFVL